MNREIKFRAWDRKVKGMCFDFSIHFGINTSFIPRIGTYNKEGIDKYWKDNMTVMQYTGLKDKNGKEIYESDYLEIPEVSDNSKTWCVFWGSGKYILHNISTGDILDCNEENTSQKEVTGNSFESPREHKTMASDL